MGTGSARLYFHGKTIEETKRNIQEAIEFHLEGMREDGLPIPEPTSVAATVEVAA